ncbi:hypothetical protein EVAR_84296_1 [Eumeta japonica]|uniref:RNA-directed DNA polymerase from transposon X-element n=1 Tax=Eumeta variegata TaxID=151549 RepID=A0A4C1ST35_EUMVA|nr:hypothetical protein EVAR_84296_1 [Eumeta japonica]
MPFHIRTERKDRDKPVEDLRLSEDDPPFTMGGTKGSPERVKSEKGSGTRRPDGRYLHSGDRERDGVFLAIANKCLELKHFPTHWKTAHVVIIPKPGKVTPSLNPTGR